MSAVAQLFLNGAGRTGRLAFLLAAAGLVALLAGYEAWAPPGVQRWTGWLADLLLAFSACAVVAKRLHDRGRSGWWTAPVLLSFVNAWPAPHGVGWLFAVALAAMLAYLGLLPGQTRFNRFGPPPAPPWRPRTAAAAAKAR